MSLTKKILISICIIVLVAGIAFLIYWGVNNYEKVKKGLDGTGLYTSQDLEKAKLEGYQEGANSLANLEEQYKDIKNQLDLKTKTVSELTEKVNNLTKENTEFKANKEQNEKLIADLQTQIAPLKSEVSRLKELLLTYQQECGGTLCGVVFYVDDEVFLSTVVNNGEIFSQDLVPTKTGDLKYTFKGWSLDKTTVISLNSYQITENTNFYAVFEQSYYSIQEFDENSAIRVYEIASAEDLTKFSELSKTISFEGYTIYQTATIDMKNVDFTPIATSDENYFRGTFNGQGFEIKNISHTSDSPRVAFFARTYNAILKNICLTNCNFKSTAAQGNTAGLVAYCIADNTGSITGEISNIVISGNIEGACTVGGLIGNAYAYNIEISDISLNCNVKSTGDSGYTYVGAICGRFGYSYTTLKNINFNGQLTLTGSPSRAGVMFGWITKTSSSVKLTLDTFNINVTVTAPNTLNAFAGFVTAGAPNLTFKNGEISYSGNVSTTIASQIVYNNVQFIKK